MKNKFKKVLIIGFSSNLLINFTYTNSNTYYVDNVSFSRSLDSFQVSKILAKNPLKSNHLLWKDLIKNNPIDGLKIRDKKILDEYEKLIFIKADESKSRNLDQIKTQVHFQSVKEIENKIKSQLNSNFTFDKLSNGLNFLYRKRIREKLLNFYNFIIASKLLNEKHLIRLYYFISSEKKPLNDSDTRAYVYGNKSMQCASVNNNWYSPLSQADNLIDFKSGFSVTKQRFATFTHETGHALVKFYSLRSDERELYNTNNSQKLWDGNQGCEPFLNEIFDNRSFLNSEERNVTSSIIEFVINKFARIHSIVNQDYYKFAYWSGLPSQYGWTNNDEYVAEGFAYLLHTPEKERNKIWEIWYDAILGDTQDSLISRFYK